MDKILKSLDKYPVKTRLSLTGTLIVARDIAHAKLQERLNSEGSLPQYFKDHPVYYAGPAKTPEVSFSKIHFINEIPIEDILHLQYFICMWYCIKRIHLPLLKAVGSLIVATNIQVL